VLAVIAALGVFAYFKSRDTSVPPVIAGHASIIDGDTINIGGTHIRLEGIDAPEWDQDCTDASGATWPCGRRATQELRTLVGGASLTCKTHGRDQYERVLATCAKPGGPSINAELVRQGWAVTFGRFPQHAAAEAEARTAKRGIWQGGFTRPSDWRSRQSE
jgi:endonuclease YncB( thermonuclease family)